MMIKRILLWVVIVAIAAGLTYYIAVRFLTSEEDRVRDVIEGMITNAESDGGNFAMFRIQAELANNFKHHDRGVAISKPMVVRALGALLSRYTNVDVQVAEMTVQIQGETAEVILTGRVTAALRTAPGGQVEVMTRHGHNRVEIRLRKIDGDWKVTRSQLVPHELKQAADLTR
jgi:hypothetical protein